MRARGPACIVTVAVVALGLLAGAAPAVARGPGARIVVVSPRGSDGAAGTVAAPLHTVRAALRRLGSAGGTVELRGGRYHQRVDLTGARDVTVRAYRGEHAILDGAGLGVGGDISAMVTIARARNVTVSGLDITGLRTTKLGAVPVGIYVHGSDHAITIAGNYVHGLGNDNRTLGSFDINAHGIAVYGDDARSAISGLVIKGNELDHLHLGASETLVVNGNVSGWAITGNRIHDVNNIGIDAIGYEPTLGGANRYTWRNRARDGVIAGNTVTRVRSKGNPTYWDDGWCNCADGIYVDGGTRISIHDNIVTGNDIGIEVAAENARGTADHVTVTRNRVTGSLLTGISTGGYCNGASACGGVRTGSSHDNTFTYNSLRGNNQLDDGSPEVLIQYHAHHNTFAHNTIVATDSDHAVYGTVPSSDSTGNVSDHNVFGGAAASELGFGWQGRTFDGWTTYRRASGQDAHSSVR